MALVSILRRAGSVIRSWHKPAVWTAVLAVGCALGIPVAAIGQNPAQTAPNATAHEASPPAAKSPTAGAHSTHSSKHPTHGRTAKLKPAPPVVAAIHPLSPPLPDWPANNKAVPPSVSWNGRDLTIAANNSSLQQILTEVSTATGVKVDGEESDQRIFGSYGPAPARDVLNQLLEGSGYNILIIGDKGEGTPRELVLTPKGHAAPQGGAGNSQARQNSDDEQPEEQEQPEQPNGIQRRPFGLQPGQGRSPEQVQQEQQLRLQQQQQQQPQQPQPNPQPPND